MARAELGSYWFDRLAIVMASSEQRAGKLSVFGSGVSAVAAILSDDLHWALLMFARFGGPPQALIYDALYKDSILQQGHSFLLHLQSEWALEAVPEVVSAASGRQLDDWTCGLRVLSALSNCLKHSQFGNDFPMAVDFSEEEWASLLPGQVGERARGGRQSSASEHDTPTNSKVEQEQATRPGQVKHEASTVTDDAANKYVKIEQVLPVSPPRAAPAAVVDLENIGEEADVHMPQKRPCDMNADTPCENKMQKLSSRKGRKPRSQQIDLAAWLEKERPTIYRLRVGPKFPIYCTYCHVQFNANSMTTNNYVLVHEGGQAHRQACAAREGQSMVEKALAMPELVPCRGLRLEEKSECSRTALDTARGAVMGPS